MTELFTIEPYSWMAIATALICGTIVGVERQIRGKPVGIRTSALIVLGTYVFISSSLSLIGSGTDSTRVIGQVITGIGFLGAGVMLAKEGIVVGVTSAATIWALASIGVTIGLEHYLTAIKLSFVVIFVLLGVDLLEDYSTSLTRGVHTRIKDWRKSPTAPERKQDV